jgi:asparagine synthase (glutamine-hydrolysing)
VTYRLQADVPVGFYLSGGLDSSLMAALIARATPGVERHSFSIGFLDRQICESRYQQLAARHVGSVHHQIDFGWSEIASRLPAAIYHCETPLKETFDTCSLALSQHAKRQGISVVLAGDGADEMFAGYVGYRFDQYRAQRAAGDDLAALLDAEVRERVWGDAAVAYETDFSAIREVKEALYSAEVSAALDDFECTRFEIVNKERLRGRHVLHQRSYLDFKLRLSDHLISEHGDRMALAHSVEARYPFLDIDLIEYSRTIPPRLKLNGYVDKYVLRRIAERFVPKEIAGREKWGFHAPGSPYLLGEEIDWVEDLLSYDRVAREGYFNPDTVAALKRRYSQPGFRLNLPYEQDLLAVVLTFGLFRQQFGLSAAA